MHQQWCKVTCRPTHSIYFIKVLTCLVPDLATISGLCPCKSTVKSNSVRRSAITQPSAQPGSRGLFIKQEYTPAVRCECGKANKTHPWMYSERLEARRGGLFCRRRRRDERDGARRDASLRASSLAAGDTATPPCKRKMTGREEGNVSFRPSVPRGSSSELGLRDSHASNSNFLTLQDGAEPGTDYISCHHNKDARLDWYISWLT